MAESTPSSNLDVSLDAVKSALNSSSIITTEIIQLELIEAKERRDKYLEFRRDAGVNTKELLGFMPLQNSMNNKDSTFIDKMQNFLSNGIRAPGCIYPFFGIQSNGVCISRKPDTVFTVIEERVDYWILICAVAFDSKKMKQSNLFTKSCSSPYSMEWDYVEIILDGKEPGWRRHFECIQNIMYVGDVGPRGYPRNVLPIAVTKVQFRRKDRFPSRSLHILERRNEGHGKVSNITMAIADLTAINKNGGTVKEEKFDKLFIHGTTLHSRYFIREKEWPDRLYFNDYHVFSSVFKSWIINGELNIDELLNDGNVKMMTNLFYDHNYKVCSRSHPSHVFLNYFEVESPIDQRGKIINALRDFEARDMILFGCCPHIKYAAHRIYAAVPPGEIANRLGLPTIAAGRFHLIQALPVKKGDFKALDEEMEMLRRFSMSSEAVEDEDSYSVRNSSPPSTSRPFQTPLDECIVLDESDEDEKTEENERMRRETRDATIPHSSSSPPPARMSNESALSSIRLPEGIRTMSPPSPLPLTGGNLSLHLPPPPSPSLSSSLTSSSTSIYNHNTIRMGSMPMKMHPDSSFTPESDGFHRLFGPSSDSHVISDTNHEPVGTGIDDMGEENEEEGRRTMTIDSSFGHPVAIDEDEEREEEGRDERTRADESRRLDEERRNREKEGVDRSRRLSCADDQEEDEEEVVVLSPPPSTSRPFQEGFRTMRVTASHRKRHARTNALLEEVPSPRREESFDSAPSGGAGPSRVPPPPPTRMGGGPSCVALDMVDREEREDRVEREELVVWNRERRNSTVQSFLRLPPSEMVIVVDDQLFRQMKKDELTPLIKIINDNAHMGEKRILVVLHQDFDPADAKSPNKVKSIDPSVVFVMKHKGETISNFQVECCDRVKGIRGNGNSMMVYLTPNVNIDLHRNIKLVNLGFNIYNPQGVVFYLESRQYEDY